jgi:SpoVK/Ycf46/Vps4 family AAA+-type ATPase
MLVGEFLGTSALKTHQVAEAAFGGVLFIDEAYSLAGTAESGPDRFGQEALDTLVKLMEDWRDDLVVILAGYPEPMSRLMGVNPGLRSRISRFVDFPDYDDDSLERIFVQMAEDRFYVVTDEALMAFRATFSQVRRDPGLGNARTVRRLLEGSIRAVATRLMANADVAQLDPVELIMIRLADIGQA